MKTPTSIAVLFLAALTLCAGLAAAPAPAAPPAARPAPRGDKACEAVLQDVKHPKFAACLAAAYKALPAR